MVCFLDESETDSTSTEHAVLGGIVMDRSAVTRFNEAWNEMTTQSRMTKGLHMCKLGPKGDYPHLVGRPCSDMLREAVAIINHFRLFTFGASWDNRKHEALFSDHMRQRYFSVYGLAFMMAVEINRGSGSNAGYSTPIDYVLDDGNRFKSHIQQMYDSIKNNPELAEFNVGSMEFADDKNVPALQAADVIAWATRRVKAGKPLKGVHMPLASLFDRFYCDSPAPDGVIQKMATQFRSAENGAFD
jgi:hypothetical protein